MMRRSWLCATSTSSPMRTGRLAALAARNGCGRVSSVCPAVASLASLPAWSRVSRSLGKLVEAGYIAKDDVLEKGEPTMYVVL